MARHFGHLDLLVNCVGIQREQRLVDVTEEAFDEIVQVNLKAAMFVAQAAAHQEAAVAAGRAPGRQVHLLSVRAQLGMRDRGYSAYCATKGGMVMLIKLLYLDGGLTATQWTAVTSAPPTSTWVRWRLRAQAVNLPGPAAARRYCFAPSLRRRPNDTA